jgi:hypothetical protein
VSRETEDSDLARGPLDRMRMAHDPTRGVAGCTGHIGKYTHPKPNISSLSRARHQRVEPGNNLMGAPAKDDVFAG